MGVYLCSLDSFTNTNIFKWKSLSPSLPPSLSPSLPPSSPPPLSLSLSSSLLTAETGQKGREGHPGPTGGGDHENCSSEAHGSACLSPAAPGETVCVCVHFCACFCMCMCMHSCMYILCCACICVLHMHIYVCDNERFGLNFIWVCINVCVCCRSLCRG